MLFKDSSFRLKQLDDEGAGSFSGFGSVYNVEDLGGDTIVPGAFTKTLQSNGGKLPLLWQHRSDEPIGTVTASDSNYGLLVKGQLLMDLPTAQKAYQLLKANVVKGMSIGYDTIKATSTPDGGRILSELKLWELSLVTFPMNEAAQVVSVKSIDQIESLLRGVAAADVKDDMLQHLRGIETQLKLLLVSAVNLEGGERKALRLAALQALEAKLKAVTGQ